MLLRQNPTAGKAFCSCLCQGAPEERVVELITALGDHLLSSPPAQDSALSAAEAGPSKGGSPGQPEEDNAEVGNSCLSMLRVFQGTKDMGLAMMGPYAAADGLLRLAKAAVLAGTDLSLPTPDLLASCADPAAVATLMLW